MLSRSTDGAVAVAYCVLIYWLSDQPALDVPMLFPYQDKVHHAGAYALMAALAWRYFRHLFKPSDTFAAALLFSSLFGLSDELHQAHIPLRSADWFDWLADTAGAGLATVLLYLTRRRPFHTP